VNRATTLVLLAQLLLPLLGAQNELSHEALFAPNKTFPYFEATSLPTKEPTKSFDIETARFLAQASLLSYVKETKFIEKKFIESGFSDIRFFDNEGSFAFLAIRHDTLVLVFRGTESGDQRDYVTDSRIFQKPFLDYGTAHQGFIQALDWIDSDVTAAIEKLQTEKPRHLWISGHSLGGALATLYALHHPQTATAVYTMGAPRIGGIRFAKNAAEAITLYRLANDNDIIPRLPTPPFYKHIGKTYFITSSLELKTDPPFAQKWESRRKSHADLIETLFKDHWLKGNFKGIPSDYIVDHSPHLYAEALAAIDSVEAE